MLKNIYHNDEQPLAVYRQSESVLFKPMIIIMLGIYLPWYLVIRYNMYLSLRTVLLIWTLILMAYGLRALYIWHYNRYIITSKRLISIGHKGFFRKSVLETPLPRILNISYSTTGLASVLFHYGDVEVQVAGLSEPIVLSKIKNPRAIKDYLWQLHQAIATSYTPAAIPEFQEQFGYDQRK